MTIMLSGEGMRCYIVRLGHFCHIVRLTICLAAAIGISGLSSAGHIVRLVIRCHHDKLPIFLPPSLDFGSNDKSHGSL